MGEISIHRQAGEVEVVMLNTIAHLDVLRAKTGRDRRPEAELELLEHRIPVLRAAVRTLQWVQQHEAEIRRHFGAAPANGEEAA